MFKILNLNIEYDGSEPQETVDVLVSDIVVRLLRMGKFFYEQSRVVLLFSRWSKILFLIKYIFIRARLINLEKRL